MRSYTSRLLTLVVLIVMSASTIICGQTTFNAREIDVRAEIERIQKNDIQYQKRQQKARNKVSDKIRRKRLKHISDSTAYADYMIELSQVTAYAKKTWPTYKVYPSLNEAKKAYREPYFSGGHTRVRTNLRRNFRQPEDLGSFFSIGSWGYVTIKFMVDQDGYITRTKVKKGIDPEVDYELELAIKRLPQMYPGEFGGKKYPSIGTIAIEYEIFTPSPEYRDYLKRNGYDHGGYGNFYMQLIDYYISWSPAITPMIL